MALLAANISAYQKRDRQVQIWISEMLAGIPGEHVLDLARETNISAKQPLLRYPILLKDPYLRDRLDEALSRAGLGSSKMYQRPLPEIEGLEKILTEGNDYPQARDFSNRLLTLPCHFGVSKETIELIHCVLLDVIKVD